jgi:Flp pilus assembly protein protease CpaA
MILHYFVFLAVPFIIAALSLRGVVDLLPQVNSLGERSLWTLVTEFFAPSKFLGRINILYVYGLSIVIYESILLLISNIYGTSSNIFEYYILFFILVVASVTDAYTGTISSLLVKIAYTLVPLAMFSGFKSFATHMIFALIVFLVLWLLNRFDLMGGGDVEILVIISFFLSKNEFLTSFLLASIIGLVLVVVRYLVIGVFERLPFIPALLLGVAVTLFLKVSLFGYYFNT